jgi:hypothetical protein
MITRLHAHCLSLGREDREELSHVNKERLPACAL